MDVNPYRESCYACDFRKKCITMFGFDSDQLEKGCEFWEGWHELKCTCPYKPDPDMEVTVVIPMGETNYYSQARLIDTIWRLSSGVTYNDDDTCPIKAWRTLNYQERGGLGVFV